jgi:hypothetical protein
VDYLAWLIYVSGLAPPVPCIISISAIAGCLMKLFGRVPLPPPPSPPRPVPYRPRRPLPASFGSPVRDREIGHAFSASQPQSGLVSQPVSKCMGWGLWMDNARGHHTKLKFQWPPFRASLMYPWRRWYFDHIESLFSSFGEWKTVKHYFNKLTIRKSNESV